MIRGFFRLVGLLLLAGGFIFMVYDGARWVADQTLRFTRFGQFWNDVHQSSQRAFQAWVESTAPWLWTSSSMFVDQARELVHKQRPWVESPAVHDRC